MNILVETCMVIIACTIWIFFTPTIITIVTQVGYTGIELFLLNLLPWVVMLGMVARLVFVWRTGGI